MGRLSLKVVPVSQSARLSIDPRCERPYIFVRRSDMGERCSMNSWDHCSGVERDPARMSGAWVFTNTRVPVRALFENLEDGATIDEFIEWFPGVIRKQVEAVLEFTAASLDLQISA